MAAVESDDRLKVVRRVLQFRKVLVVSDSCWPEIKMSTTGLLEGNWTELSLHMKALLSVTDEPENRLPYQFVVKMMIYLKHHESSDDNKATYDDWIDRMNKNFRLDPVSDTSKILSWGETSDELMSIERQRGGEAEWTPLAVGANPNGDIIDKECIQRALNYVMPTTVSYTSFLYDWQSSPQSIAAIAKHKFESARDAADVLSKHLEEISDESEDDISASWQRLRTEVLLPFCEACNLLVVNSMLDLARYHGDSKALLADETRRDAAEGKCALLVIKGELAAVDSKMLYDSNTLSKLDSGIFDSTLNPHPLTPQQYSYFKMMYSLLCEWKNKFIGSIVIDDNQIQCSDLDSILKAVIFVKKIKLQVDQELMLPSPGHDRAAAQSQSAPLALGAGQGNESAHDIAEFIAEEQQASADSQSDLGSSGNEGSEDESPDDKENTFAEKQNSPVLPEHSMAASNVATEGGQGSGHGTSGDQAQEDQTSGASSLAQNPQPPVGKNPPGKEEQSQSGSEHSSPASKSDPNSGLIPNKSPTAPQSPSYGCRYILGAMLVIGLAGYPTYLLIEEKPWQSITALKNSVVECVILLLAVMLLAYLAYDWCSDSPSAAPGKGQAGAS